MVTLPEDSGIVNPNPTRMVLLRFTPDGGLLTETAPLSSVELSMTAKGQTTPTVKSYHQNIEIAKINAQTVYDALGLVYGYTHHPDGCGDSGCACYRNGWDAAKEGGR